MSVYKKDMFQIWEAVWIPPFCLLVWFGIWSISMLYPTTKIMNNFKRKRIVV